MIKLIKVDNKESYTFTIKCDCEEEVNEIAEEFKKKYYKYNINNAKTEVTTTKRKKNMYYLNITFYSFEHFFDSTNG